MSNGRMWSPEFVSSWHVWQPWEIPRRIETFPIRSGETVHHPLGITILSWFELKMGIRKASILAVLWNTVKKEWEFCEIWFKRIEGSVKSDQQRLTVLWNTIKNDLQFCKIPSTTSNVSVKYDNHPTLGSDIIHDAFSYNGESQSISERIMKSRSSLSLDEQKSWNPISISLSNSFMDGSDTAEIIRTPQWQFLPINWQFLKRWWRESEHSIVLLQWRMNDANRRCSCDKHPKSIFVAWIFILPSCVFMRTDYLNRSEYYSQLFSCDQTAPHPIDRHPRQSIQLH
jgi:hypothetical protein